MQSFHLRLETHQLKLKQHLAEAKPKFTLRVQKFFPVSSIRKLKDNRINDRPAKHAIFYTHFSGKRGQAVLVIIVMINVLVNVLCRQALLSQA